MSLSQNPFSFQSTSQLISTLPMSIVIKTELEINWSHSIERPVHWFTSSTNGSLVEL